MSLDLSVILINYNHASYLKARIETILAQLPDNSELILLDDASTDNSVETSAPFVQADPRFRIIVNKKNLGVERNLNYGVTLAKGEYIFPLAVDDLLQPGSIRALLDPLLDNPHMNFCSCQFASIDTQTSKEWIQPLPEHLMKAPYTVLTPLDMVKAVRQFQLTCSSSIMIKRSLWFKYGGYKHRLGSDWFFNYAIALTEGLIFVPRPLQYWRKTGSSHAHHFCTIAAKKEMLFSILDFLSKHPVLRKQFLKSQVLYPRCRRHALDLLRHPRYFDFLLQVVVKRTPLIKKWY